MDNPQAKTITSQTPLKQSVVACLEPPQMQSANILQIFSTEVPVTGHMWEAANTAILVLDTQMVMYV